MNQAESPGMQSLARKPAQHGHQFRCGILGYARTTTVLGVIPLLPDVFWIGLAITLMSGLTVGTVLTMVLVPVFYATFHGVPVPAPSSPPIGEAPHAP